MSNWHVGINRFVGDAEPRRWVFDDHNVYEGDNRIFACPTAQEAKRVAGLLNERDALRAALDRVYSLAVGQMSEPAGIEDAAKSAEDSAGDVPMVMR